MTERERLIELMQEWGTNNTDSFPFESVADYLIANGVIVPPCKVGDMVYTVSRYYGGIWKIYECRVDGFTVYKRNVFMSISNDEHYCFGVNICEIGKTVFLTKEEAEKALKEREGK